MTDNNIFHLTIIYDERKHNTELCGGFGFSCFIKYKEMRVLFDTGGNQKAFFNNLNKLNISLNSITHIVFSHQHWDHTAGFDEVLKKAAPEAKIYLPQKFNSLMMQKIPEGLEVHRVRDFEQIDEGCYSLVKRGSSMVLKECFSVYEQSLVFEKSDDLIVLTGCGHPGVGKIIKYAKERLHKPVNTLVGGFHLHRSLSSTIDNVVNEVKTQGVKKIVPCHCTGERAVAKFQQIYGENCYITDVGSTFEI